MSPAGRWMKPSGGTEQLVRDQMRAGVANPRRVPHKHAQSPGSTLVI